MSSIIKFLISLPDFIILINQLLAWVRRVSGNDVQGFLQKTNTAFANLAKAANEQEHKDAAKVLADLIHTPPS